MTKHAPRDTSFQCPQGFYGRHTGGALGNMSGATHCHRTGIPVQNYNSEGDSELVNTVIKLSHQSYLDTDELYNRYTIKKKT
jgi:hypothetical protein